MLLWCGLCLSVLSRVKRTEREAEHLLKSRVKVKMHDAYFHTPHMFSRCGVYLSTFLCYQFVPNIMTVWMVQLIRTREVPGSNIGSEKD
jgi:hypothetical protein